MASKTITVENIINGAPTDLDAPPTLADGSPADSPPTTPTYGLRRADTHEVILAAGTVIPQIATGVYELEVTGLTSGVEYDYTIRSVFEGVIDYDDQDFVAGDTTGYVTVADLIARQGESNVYLTVMQTLENGTDTAERDAVLASVVAQANRRVNLKLLSAGATVPWTAPTAYVGEQVNEAALLYAFGYLVKRREDWTESTNANQPTPGDSLIAEGDAIFDTLIEVGALTEETTDDALVADAPVAVAATVDADGCDVDTTCTPCNLWPAYRVWR